MPYFATRLPKVGALLLACAFFGTACDNMPTASDAAARGLTPTGPHALATTNPNATVRKVSVTFVSGAINRSTWTIAAGTTEQFSATAYDSLGHVISGRPVVFSSTNAAELSIDSTTGLATAVSKGTVAVKAMIGGVTGQTGNFSVTGSTSATSTPTPPPAPAPAPAPAPTPAPATSIAVQVVRFDGGSGAATVTAGVPLVQGSLRPGQEGNVRVYVGGIEQPVYVTGLASLHPDGSLRAMLVQFTLASLSSATPATGFIDLTTARPAAMTLSAPIVTPGTAAPSTPTGVPQAAILPTSVSYLMSTDLVGPTVSSAATTALGGNFARYESDFVKYANQFWASEGATYDADMYADYYDRTLIYYAMWARTGNATYWARAGQMAYDYRTNYLEPNAYGSSPHWAQLEGLEKHYLLTGDDASRGAVVKTAYVLDLAYLNTHYMDGSAGESRIAARVLHSQLLAWRLMPAGVPTMTFRGANMATVKWGPNVESAITKIAAWQVANGSYPAVVVCGGQLNYMVGMLNDVLIKTYDYYLPATTSRSALQATIQTLVQKAVDYMWTTQWRPTNHSFNYASVNCSSKSVGSQTSAPDLNNMISTGFGWLWKRTGNQQYLTEGDAIFDGGVTQAYLTQTKQFNEEYTSSFRYLGYR